MNKVCIVKGRVLNFDYPLGVRDWDSLNGLIQDGTFEEYWKPPEV